MVSPKLIAELKQTRAELAGKLGHGLMILLEKDPGFKIKMQESSVETLKEHTPVNKNSALREDKIPIADQEIYRPLTVKQGPTNFPSTTPNSGSFT